MRILIMPTRKIGSIQRPNQTDYHHGNTDVGYRLVDE